MRDTSTSRLRASLVAPTGTTAKRSSPGRVLYGRNGERENLSIARERQDITYCRCLSKPASVSQWGHTSSWLRQTTAALLCKRPPNNKLYDEATSDARREMEVCPSSLPAKFLAADAARPNPDGVPSALPFRVRRRAAVDLGSHEDTRNTHP